MFTVVSYEVAGHEGALSHSQRGVVVVMIRCSWLHSLQTQAKPIRRRRSRRPGVKRGSREESSTTGVMTLKRIRERGSTGSV